MQVQNFMQKMAAWIGVDILIHIIMAISVGMLLAVVYRIWATFRYEAHIKKNKEKLVLVALDTLNNHKITSDAIIAAHQEMNRRFVINFKSFVISDVHNMRHLISFEYPDDRYKATATFEYMEGQGWVEVHK